MLHTLATDKSCGSLVGGWVVNWSLCLPTLQILFKISVFFCSSFVSEGKGRLLNTGNTYVSFFGTKLKVCVLREYKKCFICAHKLCCFLIDI